MGIDPSCLRLAPMPLKGFMRDVVRPIEVITLSVLAWKAPQDFRDDDKLPGSKSPVIGQCNKRVTHVEQSKGDNVDLSPEKIYKSWGW